jgi:hypothetical protein
MPESMPRGWTHDVSKHVHIKSPHLLKIRVIKKILAQHGMENCNPAPSPMDPNVKLEKLPNFDDFSLFCCV